jgi:hypothetical protein
LKATKDKRYIVEASAVNEQFRGEPYADFLARSIKVLHFAERIALDPPVISMLSVATVLDFAPPRRAGVFKVENRKGPRWVNRVWKPSAMV